MGVKIQRGELYSTLLCTFVEFCIASNDVVGYEFVNSLRGSLDHAKGMEVFDYCVLGALTLSS